MLSKGEGWRRGWFAFVFCCFARRAAATRPLTTFPLPRRKKPKPTKKTTALIKRMKYALVWGTSAKHRPQRVGKEHVLQDEDIVSLVLR